MSFFHSPRERIGAARTVQALLVHEGRDGRGNSQSHWLTSHPVEQDERGPIIMPGRALSETDKRALIDTLIGTLPREEFTVLPARVLAIGTERVVWYVAGKVRPMYFNVMGRTSMVRVPWPPLVFFVSRRHLSLAALPKSRRPASSTPLFHAPLMNVNASGSVCTGSAPVPEGSALMDCEGYERAVFESNFSHVSHANTLRHAATISNEAHVRFWKSLGRREVGVFPSGQLVPMQRTLGEWLAE